MCVVWIRFAHANSLSGQAEGNFPWDRLPSSQLAWTLQSIAVFPLRNEPAPAPVYLLWGIPLALVLVALFQGANARERVAAGAILVILVVVPTILSVLAFPTQGMAWQGRYSLPLWLGITAIAGRVLDRRRKEPGHVTTGVLFALLAIATTVSTVHVGMHEVATGTSDPAAASIPGGFLLVGVLTVLGVGVGLAPLARAGGGASGRPQRPTTQTASILT